MPRSQTVPKPPLSAAQQIAADTAVDRIVQARMKRAAAFIRGARNCAASLVGLASAKELMLDELHDLVDQIEDVRARSSLRD